MTLQRDLLLLYWSDIFLLSFLKMTYDSFFTEGSFFSKE